MTEREKTLIAGCVNGDKAAWDEFVRQYGPLVYHTIYKTLTLHHASEQSAAAEDLFQEFFVSCLRDGCKKLRQFRGDRGCSVASWLRVIAARLTVDHLRQHHPVEVEVDDAIPSGQPDADSTLIAQEEERSLSQAMAMLSARDQLIVDLVCRQALSPEEVASTLKMSVGAVYTQKSRALDKLREILGKTVSV